MSENGSCDVPFYIYFVLRIRVAEIKEILSEKKVIFLKNSGRQLILSAVKLCRLSLSQIS